MFLEKYYINIQNNIYLFLGGSTQKIIGSYSTRKYRFNIVRLTLIFNKMDVNINMVA